MHRHHAIWLLIVGALRRSLRHLIGFQSRPDRQLAKFLRVKVFFINLPIAAAVLALTLRIPESRNPGRSQNDLDWAGTLLAVSGLGGVVFALIQPAHGLIAGLAGITASIAFVFVERRSPVPMIPLALFRSRNFTGANLLTLFLYAAFSAVLFFFPMDLIQIEGYSPTEAGAALVPLILLLFFLSRWSGGLVAHYGAKPPLVVAR